MICLCVTVYYMFLCVLFLLSVHWLNLYILHGYTKKVFEFEFDKLSSM